MTLATAARPETGGTPSSVLERIRAVLAGHAPSGGATTSSRSASDAWRDGMALNGGSAIDGPDGLG
jgi:hypothetical protein